jgi:hypothetical protein
MESIYRNNNRGFTHISYHYHTLKSERLSVGAELTVYKALIRSMLTYACPVWEFAADSYLLKLQRLQNRALRIIGNPPRHIPICELT